MSVNITDSKGYLNPDFMQIGDIVTVYLSDNATLKVGEIVETTDNTYCVRGDTNTKWFTKSYKCKLVE